MTVSVASQKVEPVDASQRKPRSEVPGLTGLRFVAAFAVFIAHSPEYILQLQKGNLGWIYWIEQGANLGMVLFFVLSGFVIHYNYRLAVTEGGVSGVSGFIWARFARLYPLYIFIVVLDVLLGQNLFKLMAGNGDAFAEELRALPYYATFTQSWRYASFGDSTLFSVVGSRLAVTWSISTEWFFYLSYPFIALLVIRARRPVFSIVAILAWCLVWPGIIVAVSHASPRIDAWAIHRYGEIAGLAHGGQDAFYWWMMYVSPYFRIGEFVLGCLVAQLYTQLQGYRPTAKERMLGWLLLGIGLTTIPIVTYIMYGPAVISGFLANVRSLSHNFGYAPSVALLLFCAARYDTWFSRIMNWRPLVALGEASYSIYLIHFFVLVIVSSVVADLLPLTLPNVVFAAAKYLYVVALVLVLSLGLHAFIEVPARRWLRSLWGKVPGERRAAAYSILASPVLVAVCLVLIVPHVPGVAPIESGLSVISATYGGNCGVRIGNATPSLRKSCNGKNACDYLIDVNLLGDPAPGCAKNFAVEYECMPDQTPLTKLISGEAGRGTHLDLSCVTRAAAAGSSLSKAPSGSAETLIGPDGTPSSDGIRVRSATYGGNCGAPTGNVTADVQMTCDGGYDCPYKVDNQRLGDPAPKCGKAFTIDYACAPDGEPFKIVIPGEAGFGKIADLRCPPSNHGDQSRGKPATKPNAADTPSQIRILTGTYGGNCGAHIGNASAAVKSACDGRSSCDYKVDVKILGDPAPHCSKSFFVNYQCGDIAPRRAFVPGEAGLGSKVHLSCP